jgi:hypothetical protein
MQCYIYFITLGSCNDNFSISDNIIWKGRVITMKELERMWMEVVVAYVLSEHLTAWISPCI